MEEAESTPRAGGVDAVAVAVDDDVMVEPTETDQVLRVVFGPLCVREHVVGWSR